MAKKKSQSKNVEKIAGDLTRKIVPAVKRFADGEPGGVYAHCAAQNCSGHYHCESPHDHSCSKSFVCSGPTYKSYPGEDCPGEFSCQQSHNP